MRTAIDDQSRHAGFAGSVDQPRQTCFEGQRRKSELRINADDRSTLVSDLGLCIHHHFPRLYGLRNRQSSVQAVGLTIVPLARAEERSVGTESVRTYRFRWLQSQ